MYDPEMRKDCPMRGTLGNCSPVGGFCMDAVSDEICEAVHNAYDLGLYNALKTLKEQEAVEPKTTITYNGFHYDYCGDCGRLLPVAQDFEKVKFCPHCGRSVKWNE